MAAACLASRLLLSALWLLLVLALRLLLSALWLLLGLALRLLLSPLWLLLFRLSLLLLFRGLRVLLVLLLLCVRGSNGSEKKEQNSRADKSNWFHECCLHYVISCDLLASGAVISGVVSGSGCIIHPGSLTSQCGCRRANEKVQTHSEATTPQR